MSRASGSSPSERARPLATRIERQLRDIHQALRRPVEAAYAQGELTGPQRAVLEQIARRQEGIGVAELAKTLGLAHSTVSGIVDRLQKRQLVSRLPDPDDGRLQRVMVAAKVRSYVDGAGARLTDSAIAAALRRATPEERSAIEIGLAALHRLLVG